MGKAAKNEAIKLRATFFNNIAVGLFVAGAAVPYLTVLVSEGAKQPDWFWPDFSAFDFKKTGATITVTVFALVAATFFRWLADKTIQGIED